MKEVPALLFDMEGIKKISFLSSDTCGIKITIALPMVIPFIDLMVKDEHAFFEKFIKEKSEEIFYSITGYTKPVKMSCSIGRCELNITPYYHFLFQNSENDIYLLDTSKFRYHRLIMKDIFILYVSDSNMDDNHLHEIENRISLHLLNKKVVFHDTFNFNKRRKITEVTEIRKILDYNICKMMEYGWSDEDITFLIVYDNLPIDKIMQTEKIAQQIGRYYESVFIGDRRGYVYNIDSQDDENFSVSTVSLPTFGEDVIEFFHL